MSNQTSASSKTSPAGRRSGDRLIRKKCPFCEAEIALSASALDKRLNCPKCRRAIVIPSVDPVPEKQSLREEEPAVVEVHIPRNVIPPAVADLPARAEEIPDAAATPAVEDNSPVIYCLCNGVIKRHKLNTNGKPGEVFCCLHLDKIPSG